MLHSAYVHAFGNDKINSLALCPPGSSVENHIALGLREQQIKGESKYIKRKRARRKIKVFNSNEAENLNTHTRPSAHGKELE